MQGHTKTNYSQNKEKDKCKNINNIKIDNKRLKNTMKAKDKDMKNIHRNFCYLLVINK